MIKFKPEQHKRLIEKYRIKFRPELHEKLRLADVATTPTEREPFLMPPEEKFIGDKKPYIIYKKEFKTKKLSKKYGNGAKEHFIKQIELLPVDEYLSQYHTRHIVNIMDRYYRLPKEWRKYRPYITGIIYTLGHKYKERTFKFYLSKPFYNDPTNLLTPNIINPGVFGSCLCFESCNVHENTSDRIFVAKMFRRVVEEQVLQFRWDMNAQSGIHEIHHDKISFLEIMLSFARDILKISDREEFEKQMRPLGMYFSSEGSGFNLDIPKAVIIQETFQKYHQRKAYLIKTLKKSHKIETSEDTKFNTSLRKKLNEI